ncbi:hypothetical protein BLS_008613 [Venturia inaequalis]|uniref:Uncharacterized protein n=1 Tax=Venturia inaequalis TaxID=5025 RepID=A0A8H3USM5_VENIN|nr:hypothetical protein EG328_003542 [Venturia inaequalis]KAE9980543.1 hypothetical protein BLS_008613 [Venturia inaequalis]RDI80737.1 hypothetical protein Vi05172_g9245 [Venturia inaequalis]
MVTSPPQSYMARRRSSARRSSGAQLPAALNSPRGPMPRDDNAFCYQSDHIQEWLLPEGVFEALPEDLQAKVKNMQQSGAAVVTSLERVEKMRKELPPSAIKEDEETVCEQPVPLTEVNGKLYELQASLRASESAKEEYDCVPIPLEYRSFSSASDTVFSSDQNTPDTNVTGCPSPMSLDQSTRPDSPAPLDTGRSKLSRQSSNTVALPPDNPQIGQYWAQLVHLRAQDVVRLRHSMRLVDIELSILKGSFASRSPTSSPGSPAYIMVIDPLQPSVIDSVFQEWWSEKKALAHSLMEKCGRIDPHIKPNLGWS